MVFNGFDSLKAFSIGNHSRRRKLKWLFEFLVLLFLVLNQSSLFSLAAPLIRHFFRHLLLVFNSHLFVFFVFHAMLFLVYSLSHLTDNNSASNRTSPAATGGDLPEILAVPRDEISVEEKITATSLVVPVVVVGEKNAEPPPPEILVGTVEDSDGELLIVGEKIPALSPTIEVSLNAILIAPFSPVRHMKSKSEPEISRYRRTESERFEENQKRIIKLRRSKTGIYREPARLINRVDEMDIDDFNRTVESFIAEQKLHIGGRISGSDELNRRI